MSNAIEEMWNNFKTIMYTTAANGLDHLKCKNTDWFQEHEEEIQSLLARKQKAHMQYLTCDLQQNKNGCSPCQSQSPREDPKNEKYPMS